jgi:hypothetical protein
MFPCVNTMMTDALRHRPQMEVFFDTGRPPPPFVPVGRVIIVWMLTRYIQEAMRRGR